MTSNRDEGPDLYFVGGVTRVKGRDLPKDYREVLGSGLEKKGLL